MPIPTPLYARPFINKEAPAFQKLDAILSKYISSGIQCEINDDKVVLSLNKFKLLDSFKINDLCEISPVLLNAVRSTNVYKNLPSQLTAYWKFWTGNSVYLRKTERQEDVYIEDLEQLDFGLLLDGTTDDALRAYCDCFIIQGDTNKVTDFEMAIQLKGWVALKPCDLGRCFPDLNAMVENCANQGESSIAIAKKQDRWFSLSNSVADRCYPGFKELVETGISVGCTGEQIFASWEKKCAEISNTDMATINLPADL